MGIEKIGLNTLNTILPKPRNYNQKFTQMENARREYHSMNVRWEKTAEEQRIRAESERIADINKINAQGKRSPSPEVPYIKGVSRENVLYYKLTAGAKFDKFG